MKKPGGNNKRIQKKQDVVTRLREQLRKAKALIRYLVAKDIKTALGLREAQEDADMYKSLVRQLAGGLPVVKVKTPGMPVVYPPPARED